MLAGRTLIIANSFILDPQTQQPQWGGLSLILPLTFYNWSPAGSSIYRVRLIIGRNDNQARNFDMIWTKFIEFSDGGTNLEIESIVHPIPIAGKSSIVKFIQFDWNPFRQEKIDIREGQYQLKLYAWTGNNQKPDLKETMNFIVTNEQAVRYQQSVQNNETTPIDITLGETRQPNNVITRQDIENDYG
ncbi:MAG: hypothetical protein AB4058_16150 [Microcystaceae cyanobacterium]